MRSATLLAAFGVFGWAGFSGSALAVSEPVARIWLPEPHVVCDRAQMACFDSYGISLGYTQVFLGDDAEQALLEKLRQNQEPDTIIQPDGGVSCSLTEQVCVDDFGVSVELTKLYFDQAAADRLTDQVTRKIYMPLPNVACDMDQSICFDDSGYSLGYTQFYLGREAAAAWLEEIGNGNEPDISFSPAEDVLCDLTMKVCVDAQGASIGITEEWFGPAAAAALTEKMAGSPRLESACRDALATTYRVSAEAITLEFARSDEGGSAYGFDLPDGRSGVCRVLDDGTIDYIQGS